MKLENLAIPTDVMRQGMHVSDFLRECVKRDVPGIPYVDEQGVIAGRISIRHCFKESCVPHYIINAAHLLGDNIDSVNIPDVAASELLQSPVERFLLAQYPAASSSSPVIKGLAIMEQLNTSYIFLIDGGNYRGVVTRMGIARRIIEAGGCDLL